MTAAADASTRARNGDAVAPGFAVIPGAREPGLLTTFQPSVPAGPVGEGPSTMDAVTTAERQREGGGAPSQRQHAAPSSGRRRLADAWGPRLT